MIVFTKQIQVGTVMANSEVVIEAARSTSDPKFILVRLMNLKRNLVRIAKWKYHGTVSVKSL